MDDGAAELELFRRRWRAELTPEGRRKSSRGPAGRGGRKRQRGGDGGAPEPVRGWGCCGGVARWEPEEEQPPPPPPLRRPPRSPTAPDCDLGAAAEARGGGKEDLLEQLILDLNEINEVPFFDVQLPYELALKIFQFLGRTELGRCAQNRIGAVSQLQYELGKVLCDVHSCDGVVIAGYTSGDVKLWDTRTWDYTAPALDPEHGLAEPGPRPHASFVRINSSLAAAAYEDGTIKVWSLLVGRDPIHCSQHNQKIQSLALSAEGATIATASAFQVKVESANDKGYWETAAEFEIQKLVGSLCLVPCVMGLPVAVATAEDVVYLLKVGDSAKVLHSVYGQPATCLDVTSSEAAFGVKGFGWLINETNKILLYNLETGQCTAQLGSSLGDFSCVNLRDSPPSLLVAGNKDRRVRVFDLRISASVCSLYGHQLGVSSVQMDDWKIVSGGEEGLVCVWDQRMGTKLWEIHARHPVRHIWFNSHSLITANIPDEKVPRGASIMDDDLTAHRRHRGIIYAYEFSVDQLAAESILPICRSSYNETTGYNYNIGLAVPYDNI
ncbi:F-box/WD repeat-containing protein 8 isoform X3 [Podarcis raffonei]|uniref:F-box/WD repeat-containing protein 8 isoform X3 n=1 Tax=Podarcis raffonei TaxID=65483 RepID=UPI0023291172|nr:F-box/WD repeat-containing protein 8 isoform X3 [Podarcis raffonei]